MFYLMSWCPLRDLDLFCLILLFYDFYSICLSEGISFREVAPSWSKHDIWEEAFITSKYCSSFNNFSADGDHM